MIFLRSDYNLVIFIVFGLTMKCQPQDVISDILPDGHNYADEVLESRMMLNFQLHNEPHLIYTQKRKGFIVNCKSDRASYLLFSRKNKIRGITVFGRCSWEPKEDTLRSYLFDLDHNEIRVIEKQYSTMSAENEGKYHSIFREDGDSMKFVLTIPELLDNPYQKYDKKEKWAILKEYPDTKFDENGRIIAISETRLISPDQYYIAGININGLKVEFGLTGSKTGIMNFDSLYRICSSVEVDIDGDRDSMVYEYEGDGPKSYRQYRMNMNRKSDSYKLVFSREINRNSEGGRLISDYRAHSAAYWKWYKDNYFDLSITTQYTYDSNGRFIQKRQRYRGVKIFYNSFGKIETVEEYYVPDEGREILIRSHPFEYHDGLLHRILCRFPSERPMMVYSEYKNESGSKSFLYKSIYEFEEFLIEYDNQNRMIGFVEIRPQYEARSCGPGFEEMGEVYLRTYNYKFSYNEIGALVNNCVDIEYYGH